MKARLLRIGIVVMVLGMLAVPISPAFAATTADVTITATPTYIAMTISNAPNTWAIGTVVINTTYWWTTDGNAPSPEPFEDADMKETITNTGSVAEDIDVKVAAFTGGVGWTISLDDTPAENEVSVRAGITGTTNAAAMVQVITTDSEIIDNLAASGTKKVCLSLKTGTFTDGVAKSGTLTYTASAYN